MKRLTNAEKRALQSIRKGKKVMLSIKVRERLLKKKIIRQEKFDMEKDLYHFKLTDKGRKLLEEM